MDATIHTAYLSTPIGVLRITGSEQGIATILFCDGMDVAAAAEVPECLKACVQQLKEYFEGARREFSLMLSPTGTAFQKQVWQQLEAIPYGKTSSYLSVARAVSGEKAIRAVGAANGRNPLCIVVPCHRVIGSDGSLTGYAGGLWRKEWLLQHEGVLQKSTQGSLF